jgi:predicted transposase YbfD/YdcC
MNISLYHAFADLEDPRQAHKVKHRLQDIIVLAIVAVLSNAQSWTQIEAFGQSKEEWLKQWLELENGIPTHDTIQRVFQALSAEALMKCFGGWTASVMAATEGRFVAVDGKTLRGSHDSTHGQKALHLVRAWATEQGVLLGQQRVDEKTNEITAIPDVLAMLALKGCIVTIDAMGCQTDIATQICEQKADYVLALKENQKTLYPHAVDWFDFAERTAFRHLKSHDYARTVNKAHGRIEVRECWLITDTLLIVEFREQLGWTGLRSLVKIRRTRTAQGITTQETAYYITSLTDHADTVLAAVRRHWAVENECHWVLDVIFNEDRSRIRCGESPENFSLIRQLVLSILKQDKSKGSLTSKRFRAALDDNFRLSLLQSFMR